MRLFAFWDQLLQDFRYAVRTMAGQPLFTAMAALSLALGIGANTAIYSFMDAILMRALPVQNPESLVVLNWRSKDHPAVVHSLNGTNFRDPKQGTPAAIFPSPPTNCCARTARSCLRSSPSREPAASIC
jgi:hypothetical protein